MMTTIEILLARLRHNDLFSTHPYKNAIVTIVSVVIYVYFSLNNSNEAPDIAPNVIIIICSFLCFDFIDLIAYHFTLRSCTPFACFKDMCYYS